MTLPVSARRTRLGTTAIAAAAIAVALAPAARAGKPTSLAPTSSGACGYALEQPFGPWGDSGFYGPTPTGSFEDGTAKGWTLTGGAAVTPSGNPHRPTSSLYALSLPAGSSATSAPVCVEAGTPYARLFAETPVRNPAYREALKVEIVYTDAATGKTVTHPVTTLSQRPVWGPAERMTLSGPVSVKPNKDGKTTVSYKFTPLYNTSWSIDDLLIDPKKH